uniref:Reverse transcriptase domain-containing protein n=1 Tax=Lepisosteus oculatus TaxID=7918 RepID=W5NED8_LEPOC
MEEVGPLPGATVRKDQKKMNFEGIQRKDGVITKDAKGMVREATSFYRECFKEVPILEENVDRVLDRLQMKITEESKIALERELSSEEVKEALFNLSKKKVPGLDGIPKEFYETFWPLIKGGGRLGTTMRTGVLSLLYKKGDKTCLENWRPIQLLTTDYKILAKILCSRLREVLSDIIKDDQTCGVKGRTLLWNLYLIKDTISLVEDRNLPLILTSLDQEKAFDRVS